MKRDEKIITVFGSSRPRTGDPHYQEALTLGRALAERDFSVCTGGYAGLMEAVSHGAREAGGRALGVTARFFESRANPWVSEEIRVDTWQDRLFELIRKGDGYVACRGGTGTLVELAVVWEMLSKGVMEPKPIVILGDFWRPVIERVREGEPGHPSARGERDGPLIQAATSPAEAAEYLAAHFGRLRSQQKESASKKQR